MLVFLIWEVMAENEEYFDHFNFSKSKFVILWTKKMYKKQSLKNKKKHVAEKELTTAKKKKKSQMQYRNFSDQTYSRTC